MMRNGIFKAIFRRGMILSVAIAMLFSTALITGCDSLTGNSYGGSKAGSAVQRRYFGNQLDSDIARMIYDEMVQRYFVNQEEAQEMEITFPEPLSFEVYLPDNWDNDYFQQTVKNNADYNRYRELIARSVTSAFTAFGWDYPVVYWIYWFDYSYSYNGELTGNDYKGHFDSVKINCTTPYDNAYADRNRVNRNIASAVSAIRSMAEDDSRYATLRAIHDYISLNADYDYTAAASSSSAYHYAYTAAPLFNGIGTMVCEGYAKTFKVLCDEFEISCLIIEGNAFSYNTQSWEGHAWNYVRMDDGNCYAVDVTWDDQESRTEDKFFLCGDRSEGFYYYFGDSHLPDGNVDYSLGQFSFEYPQLHSTGYDPAA